MKLRTAFFLLVSGVGCKSYALPPVIDNSAYPPNAAPNVSAMPAAAPAGTAVFELMGRIEQMQTDIQQLTGKVEEQANLIAELKKKQASMYGDFDDRLQTLENKGSLSATPPPPVAGPETPEASQESIAPSSEKQAPIDSPANLAAAVNQGSGATNPPAAEPAPQIVQASGNEKQAYQNAYTLLRTNRPEEAIAAFKTYLLDYPNGGYATNAQYGLGEAFRLNKDSSSAQQAFMGFIEKYPKSVKVSDALFMLGILAAEQNNPTQAQQYFNRVINEFPNTPAAHKAAKKITP